MDLDEKRGNEAVAELGADKALFIKADVTKNDQLECKTNRKHPVQTSNLFAFSRIPNRRQQVEGLGHRHQQCRHHERPEMGTGDRHQLRK